MKIPQLKKKAFSIELGVYPYTIFVGFLDLELLRKELLNYKLDPPSNDDIDNLFKDFKDGTFAGRVKHLNNGNIIVYFPNNFINQNYMTNVITHEAFHCTQMVLDHIGLKLNFKNDEAFAYLNGYINQKIFDEI